MTKSRAEKMIGLRNETVLLISHWAGNQQKLVKTFLENMKWKHVSYSAGIYKFLP